MITLGLDVLLAPMTADIFLSKHWPKKPLFIPADIKKLNSILLITQLQNLESVIDARTQKVRACLPDFDDEYSSIHLDAKDALKAYNNNMTLVFDSMNLQDKDIANSLEQIRSELGLVTGGPENNLCKARSIVYATPAGSGTRLHFDANVNFIIQLHGSKRWILAPNTSVENPTERFTAGSLEMSAALEQQCHAALIDQVPEDSLEFLMTPGCVLFVPRGYWHETNTDEDSMSLNFTFSQPTWADVFTKSLQEHLFKSAVWRELADGLESTNPLRQAKATAQFEVLVKSLSKELPYISGKQLLEHAGFIQ